MEKVFSIFRMTDTHLFSKNLLLKTISIFLVAVSYSSGAMEFSLSPPPAFPDIMRSFRFSLQETLKLSADDLPQLASKFSNSSIDVECNCNLAGRINWTMFNSKRDIPEMFESQCLAGVIVEGVTKPATPAASYSAGGLDGEGKALIIGISAGVLVALFILGLVLALRNRGRRVCNALGMEKFLNRFRVHPERGSQSCLSQNIPRNAMSSPHYPISLDWFTTAEIQPDVKIKQDVGLLETEFDSQSESPSSYKVQPDLIQSIAITKHPSSKPFPSSIPRPVRKISKDTAMDSVIEQRKLATGQKKSTVKSDLMELNLSTTSKLKSAGKRDPIKPKPRTIFKTSSVKDTKPKNTSQLKRKGINDNKMTVKEDISDDSEPDTGRNWRDFPGDVLRLADDGCYIIESVNTVNDSIC